MLNFAAQTAVSADCTVELIDPQLDGLQEIPPQPGSQFPGGNKAAEFTAGTSMVLKLTGGKWSTLLELIALPDRNAFESDLI